MSGVSTTISSTPATNNNASAAGGGSTSAENQAAASTAAGGQTDFRTSIPEAYREKPYLRDVKSNEDVFKMLDNAQGLIGKQGKNIPAPDAPQAEWDSFYAAAGRPESADKYEFETPQGAQRNAELDKAIKAVYHKNGLSSKQAKTLQSDLEKMFDQNTKAAQAQLDKEFDSFVEELFPGKADQALKDAEELLHKMVPPAAEKFMQGLPNQAMILLASVLKNVKDNYVGEDTTKLKGGGSSGGSQSLNTLEEIQAELGRLMAKPEYNDAFHKDHAKVRAEISAVSARANNLSLPRK